jgi:hypothetical protein
MFEHDLAQRLLIGPEVGFAAGFDVPLNLEHD